MSPRHDYPERVALLGNFYAYLTADQMNEWHDHIVDQPQYLRYHLIGYLLEMAMRQNDNYALETLAEERVELEKELHRMAREWCELHSYDPNY